MEKPDPYMKNFGKPRVFVKPVKYEFYQVWRRKWYSGGKIFFFFPTGKIVERHHQ